MDDIAIAKYPILKLLEEVVGVAAIQKLLRIQAQLLLGHIGVGAYDDGAGGVVEGAIAAVCGASEDGDGIEASDLESSRQSECLIAPSDTRVLI
mmetsp:Transcript_37626/g.56821  ORF Transcript_37626/g.56821 Transcript_37626/m.56821 type:complete len:94 (-) Transcript_37626:647-928(-)